MARETERKRKGKREGTRKRTEEREQAYGEGPVKKKEASRLRAVRITKSMKHRDVDRAAEERATERGAHEKRAGLSELEQREAKKES